MPISSENLFNFMYSIYKDGKIWIVTKSEYIRIKQIEYKKKKLEKILNIGN